MNSNQGFVCTSAWLLVFVCVCASTCARDSLYAQFICSPSEWEGCTDRTAPCLFACVSLSEGFPALESIMGLAPLIGVHTQVHRDMHAQTKRCQPVSLSHEPHTTAPNMGPWSLPSQEIYELMKGTTYLESNILSTPTSCRLLPSGSFAPFLFSWLAGLTVELFPEKSEIAVKCRCYCQLSVWR